MSSSSMAVVHLNYGSGGGEIVADAIARLYDCPLYWMFSVEGATPPDDIESRRLDSPPLIGKSIFVRDLWTMWGSQNLDELTKYDLIIQSGNEAGWYVPEDGQTIVRYCHSPPRNALDRFQEKSGSKMIKTYGLATRILYSHTVPFVDRWIANSAVVARRINRYYPVPDDKIDVVHPPTSIDPPESLRDGGDYYFTWSRLSENKRFDEVIEVFQNRDEHLLIGGSGPEKSNLERMSDPYPNIDLLGYLPKGELISHIRNARGVIYNSKSEDWGIVPVESMLCGTPVIGVSEGATQYQIQDGVNGISYVRGHLDAALDEFDNTGVSASPEQLQDWALQFDTDNFESGIMDSVASARDESNVEPEFRGIHQ